MTDHIPLLPLVRDITRWSKGPVEDMACQCVLYALKARHPDLNVTSFAVPSATACTIATLLLQQVHSHFRLGKLRRLGFADSLIRETEQKVSALPQAVHLTVKRVSVDFQQVQRKPFIMVTGLPADCKSREVRAVTMLFNGYLGIAETQPNGMLVVFVWWTSEVGARAAAHHLTKMSFDPSCLCAPEVQLYPFWPAGRRPPPIHM